MPERYVYTKRFRRRHPRAHSAHVAVTSAIRAGRLVRPSACPRCGLETTVQAHHDDYSKPLDVYWLCRSCHRLLHRELVVTAEACAWRFNCHVSLVRRLIAAGKLPASKVRGEWRLTNGDIDAFLNRHRNVPRLPVIPESERVFG